MVPFYLSYTKTKPTRKPTTTVVSFIFHFGILQTAAAACLIIFHFRKQTIVVLQNP